MMSRKARVVLGIVGLLVGMAGLLGILMDRREARERERVLTTLAKDFRERGEEPTFHPGDRVRIVKWAGTFKPAETGAAQQVSAGPGQTGIVVRMEKREKTGPAQLARVRWAAQQWKLPARDQWLELPPFEATIHRSYLEHF